MTVHLEQRSIRLVLAAVVACLAAFASSGGQVSAGAPNPCELLTQTEAETALEAPLDGEPFFSPITFPIEFGGCYWSDVEGDDMSLRWFNGSEEDAVFLFENTIAPYSEAIPGLGDRAEWVSQVELLDFIWFELRVQVGNDYLSLDIERSDPEDPLKQLDNTAKMLETMAILLEKVHPRPAVEFTQAIQEFQDHYELAAYLANHDGPPVPIIAGKPAVARVYFDEGDNTGTRTVELTGVGSDEATVTLKPGCSVEEQRRQEGGCQSADLYFTPPNGLWIAEIAIKDADGVQLDKLEFAIKSLDTQSFGITYLPVCVALGAGAVPTCPSIYIENDAAELMSRIYPVAKGEFFYSRMPLPALTLDAPVADESDEYELLADLRLRWELLSLGSSPTAFSGDQLTGWLPGGGAPLSTAGISDPVWMGSTGHVAWQMDLSATPPFDGGTTEFLLAHEVGHNLGLRHTNLGDGCGAGDDATEWPYDDSTIQEVGFDVSTKEAKAASKKDLMTYCVMPSSNIWISPFTYKKLAEGGFQPQGVATPSGETSRYLLVEGTAKADGSGGSIDAAFVINSTVSVPPSNPLGNHCLYLTGGAQMDYCFNLTFTEHRTLAPLDEEAFVLRVPLPPGTTNAFLMRGNDELATLELSANAPTVEITSPQPGTEWSGEQTIEWTASDADGGPMSFAVLYSPDGGANWLPMEVGSDGDSEFTFNARDLTGGEIMVRVLASDGLNTTEDTVGSITLANGEPRLWGDNDCDGDVDAVDGLKALQDVAGLPYSQNDPCTPLGESVGVSPTSTTERPWGDVDCDGDVDAADGLSILRYVAGLPPTQQQGCPAIGSAVLVG